LSALFEARKIATKQAPSALIRFLALFDGEIKAVLPLLGKHIGVNASSTKRDLGITFAPIEDSLVETANYLVDNGFVKS